MPKHSKSPKKKDDEKSKFMRIERAAALEVSNFLFALGNQFVGVQNAAGAFDCFKYSLDLNPFNQPAVHNLGALYFSKGELQSALRMFRESVRMDPEQVSANVALAETLRKLGEWREASDILEEQAKRAPDHFQVLSAKAVLMYDRGQLAEAQRYNDAALKKVPSDAHMLLNRALLGMLYGKWPEYWKDYEYNLSYRQNPRMKNLRMGDAWAGEECEGKTLLVIADQGYGDSIQMSRYLLEAKALGKFAKLTYLVQPELVSLMKRSGVADEVVGFAEAQSISRDSFSSLLGVMRVLQVSPENCWRPPHLVSDPQLDAVWAARLGERKPGEFRVSVTWQGDRAHGNDQSRSMPPSALVSLLKGLRSDGGEVVLPPKNVEWYSFQVGRAVQALAADPAGDCFGAMDLGTDFRHFDDTLSALRQMDLLIAVDTSIGHLAGCAGIPCWSVLSSPAEWRWGLVGTTSPWYSTAQLFRQSEPRDWTTVMLAVLRRLQEEVPWPQA